MDLPKAHSKLVCFMTVLSGTWTSGSNSEPRSHKKRREGEGDGTIIDWAFSVYLAPQGSFSIYLTLYFCKAGTSFPFLHNKSEVQRRLRNLPKNIHLEKG